MIHRLLQGGKYSARQGVDPGSVGTDVDTQPHKERESEEPSSSEIYREPYYEINEDYRDCHIEQCNMVANQYLSEKHQYEQHGEIYGLLVHRLSGMQ